MPEPVAPAVPAASPAAPAVASPASPATPGSAAASPAASDGSLQVPRELREAYERTKGELESLTNKYKPYEQLGQLDELKSQVEFAKGLRTEAQQIAQQLGYDTTDLQAAFQKDPVGTLQYLRQQRAEAAAKGGNRDPNDVRSLVKQMLDQSMKPINDFHNNQLTQAAESKFNQTFQECITESFPGEELPAEVRDALFEATWMFADDQALQQLKMGGKTAAIKETFANVKDTFLKAVNAYSAMQAKKTGVIPGQKPPLGAQPKKLDTAAISRGDFSSMGDRL